jgi:hypothetical protein
MASLPWFGRNKFVGPVSPGPASSNIENEGSGRMTTIRKIVYVAFVLILAACARGEAYKRMVRDMPELTTSDGRIFFYRLGTILPGAVLQPSILLDDKKVGRAQPKGFFYVDVPAGEHVITIHSEVKRTLTLTVKPGETKYVREDLNLGFAVGRMVPVLVDERLAKRQLRRLRFSGEPQGAAADAASASGAAVVGASDSGASESAPAH